MELFFPGSSTAKRKFDIVVHEIAPGETTRVNGVTLSALEVRHACGAPALALRLESEGKTIAYSGDSEWTETLVDIGRGADLYIVEALSFDKRISQHLDYASVLANAERMGAKRIILTHLGPEMLARQAEASHDIASDGLIVEV